MCPSFHLLLPIPLKRLTAPIDEALKDAGIGLENVTAIEVLGGGVRVPKVQAILKEYLSSSMELGMHLNGDEAMAQVGR